MTNMEISAQIQTSNKNNICSFLWYKVFRLTDDKRNCKMQSNKTTDSSAGLSKPKVFLQRE